MNKAYGSLSAGVALAIIISVGLGQPRAVSATSLADSVGRAAAHAASSPTTVIYVGSTDQHLYAINATSGKKLWSYKAAGPIRSKPALANGDVYFSSGRYVYAVSVRNGAFSWKYRTGQPIYGSPATNGGRVFVDTGLCCTAGVLYAIGAGNGQPGWTHTIGNGFSSPVCCFYSPTFRHGLLYVGAGNGRVAAVTTRTGRVVWSRDVGGDVQAAPRLSGGVLYVGSGAGSVYALDPATGSKKWRFQILGINSVETTPAVRDGVVYVGACDSHAYAVDAANGKQVWAYATGGCVPTSPAVGANNVFIGCYSGSGTPHCFNVYAINRTTGATAWTYTTGGFVLSSPALVNGVVYVGSGDKKVYALNGSSGSVVWKFATQGAVQSSPTIGVCDGPPGPGCWPAG